MLSTTNEFRNHFQNTSFHIVPTAASPRMSHQENLFNDQSNTQPVKSFGKLDVMLQGSYNSESESHFTADLKHHPGKIFWLKHKKKEKKKEIKTKRPLSAGCILKNYLNLCLQISSRHNKIPNLPLSEIHSSRLIISGTTYVLSSYSLHVPL